MSWNISLAGTPSGVQAALEDNANLTPTVKSLAKEMVGRIAPSDPNGPIPMVSLASSGHFDSYGGNATFTVQRLTMVPEPASAGDALTPTLAAPTA